MRLAIYRGEVEIAMLVRRLFKLKGQVSNEPAKAAEKAMLNANPHLRAMAKVRHGSLLIVPEVASLEYGEDTMCAVAIHTKALVRMRLALTSVRATVEESLDRSVAEALKTLKRSKARKIRSLAEESSKVRDRMRVLAEQASARIKNADSLREEHAQAFDKLGKDLDQFIQLIS
jgi:hypothetical protein